MINLTNKINKEKDINKYEISTDYKNEYFSSNNKNKSNFNFIDFVEENFKKNKLPRPNNIYSKYKCKFNENELCFIIRYLKTNKTFDAFGFTNVMFKSINKKSIEKLTNILNIIIEDDKLLNILKEVRLVLIPKTNNKYRPICITNTIKEIIDSIISYKLSTFVEK